MVYIRGYARITITTCASRRWCR